VVLRSRPIGDMKLKLYLSEMGNLRAHTNYLKVFLAIDLHVEYIKVPKLLSEISMQIMFNQNLPNYKLYFLT
jgi:hypothetical protein